MMREVPVYVQISAQIMKFIIENFLFENNQNLCETTSLLENGIIDSTGVLELIDYLEKSFGFKVEDEDIVPENLNSIRQIAAFVQNKCDFSKTNSLSMC